MQHTSDPRETVDAVDSAIDRAVQALVSGDPDLSLRARVLSQIGLTPHAGRRRRMAGPLVGIAVAACAILLLVRTSPWMVGDTEAPRSAPSGAAAAPVAPDPDPRIAASRPAESTATPSRAATSSSAPERLSRRAGGHDPLLLSPADSEGAAGGATTAVDIARLPSLVPSGPAHPVIIDALRVDDLRIHPLDELSPLNRNDDDRVF